MEYHLGGHGGHDRASKGMHNLAVGEQWFKNLRQGGKTREARGSRSDEGFGVISLEPRRHSKIQSILLSVKILRAPPLITSDVAI